MKNPLAEKIVIYLIKNPPICANDIAVAERMFFRAHPKLAHNISNSNLLEAYHNLTRKNKIKQNANLEKLFIKRPIRTLSGVAVVTVLTEPFPCPGKCIYCPNEKIMPKSYISDEPAAARALALKFNPFEQVAKRIETLEKNGHPTDKIELIVKGGTWNAYPLDYQYWFILRCFTACNAKNQKSKIKNQNYNSKTKIGVLKKQLNIAQQKNESAKNRIIGLTLETRPDFVNEETVLQMRELGCTRIELGVQTIDDKILKLIKRGHNSQETVRAVKLLKNYGFKVDFHLMPQLPGSTPSKDLTMMKEIFANPEYRPDMIKIYPCTVVKNSKLYKMLKANEYKPYADKKLIELLKKFKTTVPSYVRISRLIRDIPSQHIVAGNKITNLRQIIQVEMKKEGTKCKCLRCREIGHQYDYQFSNINRQLKLFVEKYEASGGMEYFLSFCAKGAPAFGGEPQTVFAFCRLRIVDSSFRENDNLCENNNYIYPAFIRELHTYGQVLEIGKKEKKASQHKGLGRKLMEKAEEICRKKGVKKIAVISGIGVRGYYKKIGYRLENGYMVKKINWL